MNGRRIRGACPTLAAPMATGDGLLVRFHPNDGLTPRVLASLAEAAMTHGNGIVEVTARGSLQIRGLSAQTAPRLADEVERLEITVRTGIAVDISPLAGREPGETADPMPLASRISQAVERTGWRERLAPKVSVVVDGGGVLHLSEMMADIRLMAEKREGRIVWNLALNGAAEEAHGIASIPENDACFAVVRLLEAIADKGRKARARDLDDSDIKGAMDGLRVLSFRKPPRHPSSQPIGVHRLTNGGAAVGIGLAYGQARADALLVLARKASALGIEEIRCAPERSLLFLCPARALEDKIRNEAKRVGFIVENDDKRLAIVACAGAPACRSAHLATRSLAARLMVETPELLDGSLRLHLSGCDKRCAAPRHADVSIIGEEHGFWLELSQDTNRAFVARAGRVDDGDAVLPILRRAAKERVLHGGSLRDALMRALPAEPLGAESRFRNKEGR